MRYKSVELAEKVKGDLEYIIKISSVFPSPIQEGIVGYEGQIRTRSNKLKEITKKVEGLLSYLSGYIDGTQHNDTEVGDGG